MKKQSVQVTCVFANLEEVQKIVQGAFRLYVKRTIAARQGSMESFV